jgi:hypothetical protein
VELKAVVEPRKRVLSGKRRVINGDSLITTVKHLNGIKAAEKITLEGKSKKGKAVRGRTVKVKSISSDESGSSSDSGCEGGVEIRDCIVVAT